MRRARLSTRREFLNKSLGLISVGATVPMWLGDTAFALENGKAGRADRPEDPVLVVLELSGGNDVLSTVVPHGLADYYRNRQTTAIREEQVLKIDNQIGFHPGLAQLKRRYDAGQMTVIQGVGYPNPNRSHFESMDIWHTCEQKNPARAEGWLARYVTEGKLKDDPTAAIALGSAAPRALIGNAYRGITFQDPGSFRWRVAQSHPQLEPLYKQLNTPQEGDDPSVKFLSRMGLQTNASTEKVRRAVARFRPTGRYQGRLGRDMATIAAMICGGLKTRLYYVRQGGYDTHAGQRGRHNNLMGQLSRNVDAFLTDIGKGGQGKRVIVMGFSEFGRRVRENAANGTDHGAAGGMFLWGDPVKGGLVGKHPSLTDLDRGDLKWGIDFRSVYATLIDEWLGGDSKKLLGKAYKKLALI